MGKNRKLVLLICAICVPFLFRLIKDTVKDTVKDVPIDAVTYEFSGGRFGDNLLAYLHGKWISYKYNLPLLYKEFPYSDKLRLDDEETKYKSEDKRRFRERNFSEFGKRGKKASRKPFLYTVPYFPEFPYELAESKNSGGNAFFSFTVDWTDEQFRKEVRSLVQQKSPHVKQTLPADCLTVAMHIRKGGNFDSKEIGFHIPLKAPPDQFYIDSLHKIIELFPGKKLYVHIFTDDLQPSKLVKVFQKIFDEPLVVFNYRSSNENEADGVLEDFFAMLEFDCLIRPESNYSYVASKLKDYKITISPGNVQWKNGLPYIEDLCVLK